MDAAGNQADIAKTSDSKNGGLEGDFGSLDELLAELLADWMAAGWLADRLAGGGWCWLIGWLATGASGAEETRSGEGYAAVLRCPEADIYQEP